MKKYFYLLIPFLFLGLSANAQITTSVWVKFKLFDASGTAISTSTFCKEYKMLSEGGSGGDAYLPCDEELKKYAFYHDGYLRTMETVMYDNFTRMVVHEKDTMVLKFNTIVGTVHEIKIEYLEFRAGYYKVTGTDLQQLNYVQAATDYYNDLVLQVCSHGKVREKHKGSLAYLRFRKLQHQYAVSPEDGRKKTAAELALVALTAKDIKRIPSISELDFEKPEEEIMASYFWQYKGQLLNTSNDESLFLYKDSTFYYARVCPNLDHSTSYYSGGTWIRQGRIVILQSALPRSSGRYIAFRNDSWKKRGRRLIPQKGELDSSCGRNKLRKNR